MASVVLLETESIWNFRRSRQERGNYFRYRTVTSGIHPFSPDRSCYQNRRRKVFNSGHSSTILNEFHGEWGLRAFSGWFWGADFKTIARFSQCGEVFELFGISDLCNCSFLSILLHKTYIFRDLLNLLACYLNTSNFLHTLFSWQKDCIGANSENSFSVFFVSSYYQQPHFLSISNSLLLQPLRWCCVDCVIHHERDVREEQKYMYVARTSNNRVISIVACCRGAKLCAHAAQDFRSQHCHHVVDRSPWYLFSTVFSSWWKDYVCSSIIASKFLGKQFTWLWKKWTYCTLECS